MPIHNRILHFIVLACALTVLAPGFSLAAKHKDAGHNKDYRTSKSGGSLETGRIGDSYTADLVMYLAGNQFYAKYGFVKATPAELRPRPIQ